MGKRMKEYQNALDSMSNEAVEYVRGIPVVKTFGQTVAFVGPSGGGKTTVSRLAARSFLLMEKLQSREKRRCCTRRMEFIPIW